jgi:hypothetical protein
MSVINYSQQCSDSILRCRCNARHLGHGKRAENHANNNDQEDPNPTRRSTVREWTDQANGRNDPSVAQQQRIPED